MGIDGCADGWIAVSCPPFTFDKAKAQFVSNLNDLNKFFTQHNFIIVDIPIGLSIDEPIRKCDSVARSLLGPRRSSIFAPPCKKASMAETYPEANSINRNATGHGLSKQAWMINNKIKEVSNLIDSGVILHEGHPECSFTIHNQQPMEENKSSICGFFERYQVLKILGFNLPELAKQLPRRIKAKPDDLLDAAILCWSASRQLKNIGVSLPNENSSYAREKHSNKTALIYV